MNLHNEHYIFSYLESVTKTESHFQRPILMQSLGESCSLCYAGYGVTWNGLLPFFILLFCLVVFACSSAVVYRLAVICHEPRLLLLL